jgi:ABC-type microcin C transport system duplicated ATPase subunit YejF
VQGCTGGMVVVVLVVVLGRNICNSTNLQSYPHLLDGGDQRMVMVMGAPAGCQPHA